ncbi:dipeptide ABC transporter ATP-binding protein [Hwanghaeella grinnelliae]|uniref:Dipeptide ABC transporter ATP-binding protein n=1 Tax=Hwanghaeella grinnelliae TaxID=2500179 RepID=A0A437QHV3_9PROT|nr:dipeptide ABC transporter ATP-binding protein [Hwanghaeella grinnelliae]RVU34127.1 dipeptide ABC transporter ATP-binding protein [Hwanghaeella grinnelliae]
MNAQTPLLSGNDLTRHYDITGKRFGEKLSVKALQGVSFQLDKGETLAVVGESGCGKSTLARLITMIESPTAGSFRIGETVVDRDTGKPGKELRAAVQIVFQDPYSSLNPRQKVGTILAEPLLINHPEISRADREKKARDMLALVGLRPEHYDRYPHMFSGGQRQRIAVARALMMNPKVLVLDEPVSALDLSVQAQILNLLVDLQDEFGLAYLFISHDLSVVRHMADRVMVMYLGRPVEYGERDEIFNNPKHPYTKALLSATPVADPEHTKQRLKLEGELPSPINPPAGCAFHPRCPVAIDRCAKERPDLEAVAGRDVSCWRAGESV